MEAALAMEHQNLDRSARNAVLQAQSDEQKKLRQMQYHDAVADYAANPPEPYNAAAYQGSVSQADSIASPVKAALSQPQQKAAVVARSATPADEQIAAAPAPTESAEVSVAPPKSADQSKYPPPPRMFPGYGLSFLLGAVEEETKPNALMLLQSVFSTEADATPITSLDQFRPFPLFNSEEAVVELGGSHVFRSIRTWEIFMLILEHEFANKKIKSLQYSVKGKPKEFAYVLKPTMFDELKRLWGLEKQVAQNYKVREQERIAREYEEGLERERQAAKKIQKEAEKAARKAAAKAARAAAGEDDEEEQEEEEEEEGEDEGPKLTRKEREAAEKERKRLKKEEKERTKREAEEEKEMKLLQFRLSRFVDLFAISVQFEY